jgi:hypothetical protein
MTGETRKKIEEHRETAHNKSTFPNIDCSQAAMEPDMF